MLTFFSIPVLYAGTNVIKCYLNVICRLIPPITDWHSKWPMTTLMCRDLSTWILRPRRLSELKDELDQWFRQDFSSCCADFSLQLPDLFFFLILRELFNPVKISINKCIALEEERGRGNLSTQDGISAHCFQFSSVRGGGGGVVNGISCIVSYLHC